VLWNTLDWDLDGSVTADERLGALGPRALAPLADEAGDPIALDERDLPEACAAADPAYTTKGVVLTSEVHHEARIKNDGEHLRRVLPALFHAHRRARCAST
jgi:hypothetical protein